MTKPARLAVTHHLPFYTFHINPMAALLPSQEALRTGSRVGPLTADHSTPMLSVLPTVG